MVAKLSDNVGVDIAPLVSRTVEVFAVSTADSLDTSIVTSALAQILLAFLTTHAIEIRNVVKYHAVFKPQRILELHGLGGALRLRDLERYSAGWTLAQDLNVGAVGFDELAFRDRAVAARIAVRPDIDWVVTGILDHGGLSDRYQGLERIDTVLSVIFRRSWVLDD